MQIRMQTIAVTTAAGEIVVQKAAVPETGPDEALLRVEAVGICGTDLHIFDGTFPAQFPLIQGHEISAIVERLPADHSGRLQVGDRVAVETPISCGHCYPCRIGRRSTCQFIQVVGVTRPGAFQELMVAPVANCHSAVGLPADVAAVCEPLSVGQRAVMRPHVTADDTVLVLGAGPIGLAAVITARDIGAEVMIVDLQQVRLDLAKELGASHTVRGLADLADRASAWTGGDGPAVVVDAIGAAESLERAFEVVATAGRISIVGISQQLASLSVRAFTGKELDIYGSRGTLDFPGAIALATRYQDEVQRLISHRFPLTEAKRALEFARERPQDVVKMLVQVS